MRIKPIKSPIIFGKTDPTFKTNNFHADVDFPYIYPGMIFKEKPADGTLDLLV